MQLLASAPSTPGRGDLQAPRPALSRLPIKTAAAPELACVLSGKLYLSDSGWLLLSVPNAVVRGLFDAMDEPGIELPPSGPDGRLNAHISVMTAQETEKIGPEAISERGHAYHYQLGPIKRVEPKGWAEMSACWFCTVTSPELKALRASYGLTPLPNGDHAFHITIAVRRRGVLRGNDVSKAAGDLIPNPFTIASSAKSFTDRVAGRTLTNLLARRDSTLPGSMARGFAAEAGAALQGPATPVPAKPASPASPPSPPAPPRPIAAATMSKRGALVEFLALVAPKEEQP